MSIESELRDVTGVKPKRGETPQKYLARMVVAVEKLEDTEWDKLPEEGQQWFKIALKQHSQGDDITGFDNATEDVEDEEEETDDSAEAEESETAEASAEDEDDVSTKKTAKKAAAKNAKTPKAAKTKKANAPKKAAAKRANGEAFKKVGVMAEIKRMLQRDQGATVSEIMASLTKKFPDRPEKGMEISTRAYIYVAAPKAIGKKLKKVKDEKRGTVFTLPASA